MSGSHGGSYSSSSEEERDPWEERELCWCTTCEGMKLNARRVCADHIRQRGRAPGAPSASTGPSVDMSHLRMEPPSPPLDRSSSDEEAYNVGSGRSTRRAGVLRNLRRMGMSIQGNMSTSELIAFETADDYEMPRRVRSVVKTYDRRAYGAWMGNIPNVWQEFTFWGRRYVIGPSTVAGAGRGLFIMQDVHVPHGGIVTLMPYCGPVYTWGQWHQLARHARSMSTYGLCVNFHAGSNVSQGDRLYIDGRPYTQGNIAGLINSSVGCRSSTNCEFEERTGYEPEYMPGPLEGHYVVVVAIKSLRMGDELLLYYHFRRYYRSN